MNHDINNCGVTPQFSTGQKILKKINICENYWKKGKLFKKGKLIKKVTIEKINLERLFEKSTEHK